jgi:SAM-dependent methyltransferase
VKVELADESQWPIMARQWRRLASPLRPAEEDIAIFQSVVDECAGIGRRPLRGLILGVTPELYHLAWPEGSRVMAADRTPEMIDYVWPGPKSDVFTADWAAIPSSDEGFDLVLSDGSLHLLDYPHAQTRLKQELARLSAPGGLVCFRLFVPPPRRETAQDVLAALFAGDIGDLNCLKFRLWMALQKTPSEGVAVRDVWETLHASAPDWEELARRLGWNADHVRAIDAYRHAASRYYLVGVDEVVDLFTADGAFEALRVEVPGYILGEQCPTVVFRRLSRGRAG